MWKLLRCATAGILICAGMTLCAASAQAQYRQNHHHHRNQWTPYLSYANGYQRPTVYFQQPAYIGGAGYASNPYYLNQAPYQPGVYYTPNQGISYYLQGQGYGIGFANGQYSLYVTP